MIIFRYYSCQLIFLILLQSKFIKAAEKIKSEVRTFELKMHQHITRSDESVQNASGLADDTEQMQSAMSGKLLQVNKNGPNSVSGIAKNQISSSINQNTANESRRILSELTEDTEQTQNTSGRRIVNGRLAMKNTFKYQVIFFS